MGLSPFTQINPEILSLPDIIEFAAGEHPQAYDLMHLLPCHFEQQF
jgi:hypothetical protein